jgi:diguanylate cyclase (GGDEF)-like protein
MQSELLDITIIGCLVLLFSSTYRKRATPMVRSWTLGWLLVLVHFTALLFHPINVIAQGFWDITSLAALLACGVVFLLAAGDSHDKKQPGPALPLIASFAALAFVILLITNVNATLPYYCLTAIAAVSWITYSFRLPRVSFIMRSAQIVSTLACTAWLLWTIAHNQQDIGISALLTQLYLLVGLIYMGTFRRISGGTLTVVFGLLAWSAVFPAGAFCDHLGIGARISPEFWNVPKYFVAFGMILILLEEEIIAASHQANHDRLTGLPNRAWLEEKLRKTLTQSRHESHKSALLCLDVDRFKQINDTYGHTVGDACLQEIARRLALYTNNLATAARIGGEEFSLFLHDISSVQQAENVASDILLALQIPIHAQNFTIELTASIGIAISPVDGRDAITLWRNADSAMYRAKRAGGNQFLCMSPEISRLTSEANEIELFVRRALRTDGFEVHYQPLYKITGELHSLEALVRIRHPKHGLIAPGLFIDIAEERGLIVPLGNWVLTNVCEQARHWQQEGVKPVRIGLNISALQITRPDFAAYALEVLANYGVDPHMIGMEITETAMMRNLTEATRQIKLLAEAGIAFSVDDFGTGYSSLGQLDKLPVQTLKIDRSFIDRITHSDGTRSIVEAIISMARSLNLDVVAEGVETQEQWTALSHMGCDIIQGYFLSRPLIAADARLLLSNSLRPDIYAARQL